MGNVRVDSDSQDQSSVQPIKADSKASEGPEMANVDVVFPDSQVYVFFSNITPRAQAQAGTVTQNVTKLSGYERGLEILQPITVT